MPCRVCDEHGEYIKHYLRSASAFEHIGFQHLFADNIPALGELLVQIEEKLPQHETAQQCSSLNTAKLENKKLFHALIRAHTKICDSSYVKLLRFYDKQMTNFRACNEGDETIKHHLAVFRLLQRLGSTAAHLQHSDF